MKALVVFDLDGTLAQSKSSLDAEMETLLNQLLLHHQGFRDIRRELVPISKTSPFAPFH